MKNYYVRLVTLFPALPMCVGILGLVVSHRCGAIVWMITAAITPLIAMNKRISAVLELHQKIAAAIAGACWVAAILKIGWFCGRCSVGS